MRKSLVRWQCDSERAGELRESGKGDVDTGIGVASTAAVTDGKRLAPGVGAFHRPMD